MKIDILEDKGNVFRFSLKSASNAYANAIRRIATGSVPTFAIDKVTFYENSSSIFDEYIAHRIGLVPITTPLKGYTEKDEVLFTSRGHRSQDHLLEGARIRRQGRQGRKRQAFR